MGNAELASSIKVLMKARQLSQDQLAEMLDINRLMITKLLSGDVIPSRHLQERLIERLGISREKVAGIAELHD